MDIDLLTKTIQEYLDNKICTTVELSKLVRLICYQHEFTNWQQNTKEQNNDHGPELLENK